MEKNGLVKNEGPANSPARDDDRKKRTKRPKKEEEEGNKPKKSKLNKPVDCRLIPEFFGKMKEENKTPDIKKPAAVLKGKREIFVEILRTKEV